MPVADAIAGLELQAKEKGFEDGTLLASKKS